MQPAIGGFAPTIRNRLEAALPKALQRRGGAGSPLRVGVKKDVEGLRVGLGPARSASTPRDILPFSLFLLSR